MTLARHNIRLTATLEKALRTLAHQQGVTLYAMLQRSVKTGIEGLSTPPVSGTDDREMVAEVASISTRLADVEQMLDRTLFTACAAYCYARSAAMGDEKTDEVISAEINRAYDRQRTAVAERP